MITIFELKSYNKLLCAIWFCLWKNVLLFGKETGRIHIQMISRVMESWWFYYLHGITWDHLCFLVFAKFSTMSIYFSRLSYSDRLTFWTQLSHQAFFTQSTWAPRRSMDRCQRICEFYDLLCTMLCVCLCIYCS